MSETRTPLELALEVVNASSCTPLRGVAVDVWHCDAHGVYSGYEGRPGNQDARGRQYLRGTQLTNAEGRVAFKTIYPGWYPGRTTHIHFKVHSSKNREATSQIYFPENISAEIYRTPPYSARGQKDTPNADDGVARSSPTPLADAIKTRAGYEARLRIAVNG